MGSFGHNKKHKKIIQECMEQAAVNLEYQMSKPINKRSPASLKVSPDKLILMNYDEKCNYEWNHEKQSFNRKLDD